MNNNKPKILWISQHASYPRAKEAGQNTFHYYFKNFLDSRKYEITLIAFDDAFNEESAEKENAGIEHYIFYKHENLADNLKRIINLESKYNPWNRNGNIISNYTKYKILQVIHGLQKRGYSPDIVIFEWTEMVVLISEVKKIWPNSRCIASEHDLKYMNFYRYYKEESGISKKIWGLKYQNCKKHEIAALMQCDLIMSHNPDYKKNMVRAGIPKNKIRWLVPYYNNLENVERTPENHDVLFFGAMNRPENYRSAIWFIENVMPLLKETNLRFIVLGAHPSAELLRYKSDKVIITGFVDDIKPYFEKSLCFVAPLLLGAGIKVKVIEALTSGIPVLTNDIGIEGIHAVDRKEYIHCVTVEDYEKTITYLYNHIEEGMQIGFQGKKKALKLFNLKDSLARYLNYTDSLLDGRLLPDDIVE